MATETDANGNGTTHSNEIAANHQESCLWPNALQVIVAFSHLFSLFIWFYLWKEFCFSLFCCEVYIRVENTHATRIMLHFILMRDLMRIFFPFFVSHFLILSSVTANPHCKCINLEQLNSFGKMSGHFKSNLCGSMWSGRFFSRTFLFRIQTGSLSLLILFFIVDFIYKQFRLNGDVCGHQHTQNPNSNVYSNLPEIFFLVFDLNAVCCDVRCLLLVCHCLIETLNRFNPACFCLPCYNIRMFLFIFNQVQEFFPAHRF